MSSLATVKSNQNNGVLKWAKYSALAATLSVTVTTSAFAAPIDIVYVGTWDSVSGANATGILEDQKYVIRITYDDTSTVSNNVDVLDGGFNASGNLMSTIDLSAAGNSLDVFVPMEAFDAGSPFIYTQDETNHFFFGPNSPVPTLNFFNGSDITDTNNIIGLEFEGDFAGAGNHFIELFNTAPQGGSTSMVSQVVDINTGVASTDTNGLAFAVDLIVDAGPDIVYNASTLVQTATASFTQSNDLGAARTDGDDFIDLTWSPTGTTSDNNNQVDIADSGLTMTTSTTTWSVSATEQMTLKSDSDTTNVSYDNAVPTLNSSATANASDTDFTLTPGDADLAVNTLIAGFEMLTFSALVDGLIDATTFFADLFNNGTDNISHADLIAAFGSGAHTVLFSVIDKAGAIATSSLDFNTGSTPPNPNPVPEPGVLVMMFAGLMLVWRNTRLN